MLCHRSACYIRRDLCYMGLWPQIRNYWCNPNPMKSKKWQPLYHKLSQDPWISRWMSDPLPDKNWSRPPGCGPKPDKNHCILQKSIIWFPDKTQGQQGYDLGLDKKNYLEHGLNTHRLVIYKQGKRLFHYTMPPNVISTLLHNLNSKFL